MSTAMVPIITSEGSAQELQEIFREHCHFVYRTAYSVTGNRSDAEDALQTIFLKMLQRGFPEGFSKNPRAYLYRAAINQGLNSVRSRNRGPVMIEVEGHERSMPVVETDTEDGIQQTLLNSIAQLKPHYIELLLLRYTHNYSDAQIARMLGKSRGAVAVNLYRARACLKKLMRAGGAP